MSYCRPSDRGAIRDRSLLRRRPGRRDPGSDVHVTRDGLNLLDGAWYADDPHEIWTWMRREAPVYYDEASDVWGIARYDDVLAIETRPGHVLEPSGPSSPRHAAPDDDLDGQPRAPAATVAGEPRVHAPAGRGSPRNGRAAVHADPRPGVRARRVRLRVGRRRAAPTAADRRPARLPGRTARRPARVVRRPVAGDRRST